MHTTPHPTTHTSGGEPFTGIPLLTPKIPQRLLVNLLIYILTKQHDRNNDKLAVISYYMITFDTLHNKNLAIVDISGRLISFYYWH